MLSAFIENLDADSTRVYSPKPFVLICGGTVGNITNENPISLRDAFLRSDCFSTIKSAELLQIEEIQEYFDKDCPYSELVTFENDLASLSDLVVLFPESPGSFAELGAFTTQVGIVEKLLVVMQLKYQNESSFLLKGPLAYLRNTSKKSVFSVADNSIGVNGQDFSAVQPQQLLNILKPHIEARLEESRDRTTFLQSEFSHRCKLYVGFLRECSVLKDSEIHELFAAFDIELEPDEFERMVFCCRCAGWAATRQSGFDRVHFSLTELEAAKLAISGDMKDKLRRRMDIRDHWQKTDAERLATQIEAMAS